MSICFYAADLLTKALSPIEHRSCKQVLTLGVQTCKFDYHEIQGLFTRRSFRCSPLALEAIEKTTGFSKTGVPPNYLHQRTFFQLLGFSRENIQAIDASDYEGAEIVHDLNKPIPESLSRRFDVILDAGTLEHIFSIKDAMFAIAQMCNLGGMVIHISPVDCINHGFVNFNWRFFYNFYLANGFEAITRKYIGIPKAESAASRYYVEFEPEAYTDAPGPYYETYLFCAFRKMKHVAPEIPQQENFVKAWQGNPHPASKAGAVANLVRSKAVQILERSYFGSSLVHVVRMMKYSTKTTL